MKKSFIEKAKKELKESYKQDAYIIQAVRSLDDLDEKNALVFQRLEEWIKIHFPNMPFAGEDAAYYVANMNNREALCERWPEEKVDAIEEKKQSGFGAGLAGKDEEAVQKLASLLLQSYGTRRVLEEYVSTASAKLMPNACALIEGVLAAKLLSIAGSVEKLALFPASTLQVLGAEKALFKHLRKGTLPPKHGLLFQSPYVNGQPFDKRGKAARSLAAKLAIALKADAFTGRYIADELKKDLDARAERINDLPTRNIQQKDYRELDYQRSRSFRHDRGKSFDRSGPQRERRFGDRPRKFGGERKPFGERRSFGGERRQFGGGGSSFDRPPRDFSGPHREFDGPRRESSGPRREFDRPRKDFAGPRRDFDRARGERGPRREFGGERRPFGERRFFGGERRSFGGKQFFKKKRRF
ncbi:hypothetical protein HZC09_05300 [Candidatus Micrarchaeota archaeon]|nr:hypothetical protein [Candidatus Micrarchaeota archaeon]